MPSLLHVTHRCHSIVFAICTNPPRYSSLEEETSGQLSTPSSGLYTRRGSFAKRESLVVSPSSTSASSWPSVILCHTRFNDTHRRPDNKTKLLPRSNRHTINNKDRSIKNSHGSSSPHRKQPMPPPPRRPPIVPLGQPVCHALATSVHSTPPPDP